jgi:hypothetical protein
MKVLKFYNFDLKTLIFYNVFGLGPSSVNNIKSRKKILKIINYK